MRLTTHYVGGTCIYGDVSFQVHVVVKPWTVRHYKKKPKYLIAWFVYSPYWMNLLAELERVLDEKDWCRLKSNIEGNFLMDSSVHVDYKVISECRKNSGQEEIIYRICCNVEQIEQCNGKATTRTDVEYNPENSSVPYEPYTPSKKRLDSLEVNVGESPSNDLQVEPYCPEPIMSVSDPLPMPQYKAKPISSEPIRKSGRPRVNHAKGTEKKTGDHATNAGVKRSRKRTKDTTDDESHQIKRPKTKRGKRTKSISCGPTLRLRQPKGEGNGNTTTSRTTRFRKRSESETPMTSDSSQRRLRTARTSSVKCKRRLSRKPRTKKTKETKVSALFGSEDDEDATHRATTPSLSADSNIPTSSTATSTTEIRVEPKEMFNILEEYGKKFNRPTPKKVDFLYLLDMKPEDVVNTFELYKYQITLVHTELKYITETCTSYKGLSHLLVIDILDRRIQDEMMNILDNNYNLLPSNFCMSVLLNALLPTWALLIFMDKYKMTREEAIQHIKAQQVYGDYLQAIDSPNLPENL